MPQLRRPPRPQDTGGGDLVLALSDDYAGLVLEFKNQIESDWKNAVDYLPKSTYLPNRIPNEPVDFVLIGAEPSGTWDSEKARDDLRKGFKNFCGSWEDFLLHHSIKNYLVDSGQSYYLTDLSKGAMPTALASYGRTDRYKSWFPLLERELAIVAKPCATVIAIGRSTKEFLDKRDLKGYSGHSVIHYSGQAAASRRRFADTHKCLYEEFALTVKSSHLKRTIRHVLRGAGMRRFEAETLKRLDVDNRLTESRKQLLFTYKMQFAKIRRKLGAT